LTPFQRCPRFLNGVLLFLNTSCAFGLGELVAWHLLDKRELRLILRKEEILDLIPVGGD
jgi:hypothetical protein